MIINSNSVLSTVSPKKPVRTWLVFRTVAFLMLLFIIPAENILSQTIIDSQEGLVESIQDHYRNDSRDKFFKFMRLFGSYWVIIGASPLLLHIGDCRDTLKTILIICMSAYLNSVIALSQREPRPFWVDVHIDPVICELGFGSPSKETMIGVTFFATILIEYFHSFNIWIRIVAYSFVIILQGLLGYSAIYLGVQFPHQVIMSCIIVFVYLTACFAFDERLTELVLKSGFSYSENRFYIIYWIIGTVILLFIAMIIFNFVTLAPDNEMNLKWLKEAGADCGIEYGLGYESFYPSAFIFYAAGIFVGSLVTSKFHGDLWWATPYWKRIIRAAITLGYSISMVLLFGNLHIDQIPVYDVTTDYSFHYALPFFLISIGVSCGFPYLFSKIRLIVPIDSEVQDFNQELVRQGIL